MPLKFDTLEQELNIIALMDLLTFGSGWRSQLREAVGRGPYDTIRFGVMSVHISSVDVSAKFMREITLGEVATLFNIPVTRDVPHETLPLTLTEPHPLREFAQKITDVMNETGAILQQKGYRNLAHFLLDVIKPGANGSGSRSVENLVAALTSTLPSMRDMGRCNGLDVYIFRRPQLMALNLYRYFRDADPARFQFSDTSMLTVLADDILPSLWIHLGVLKVSPDLTAMLERGDDLGTTTEQWDLRLRAAAVVAAEAVVQKAKKTEGLDQDLATMNHILLDAYLRQCYKDSSAQLKRLINKKTVWY
ncbi:hypothetical protein SpCBS45565_g03072 [Spizellomyces sp. 'palustris']|nr:hypothetical protein SpCBS45565_g03072 [Spizellomyces sp. 'palustris']